MLYLPKKRKNEKKDQDMYKSLTDDWVNIASSIPD